MRGFYKLVHAEHVRPGKVPHRLSAADEKPPGAASSCRHILRLDLQPRSLPESTARYEPIATGKERGCHLTTTPLLPILVRGEEHMSRRRHPNAHVEDALTYAAKILRDHIQLFSARERTDGARCTARSTTLNAAVRVLHHRHLGDS